LRHIRISDLATSQFPNPVRLSDGRNLVRPATWA
jgi:hypothetical protein